MTTYYEGYPNGPYHHNCYDGSPAIVEFGRGAKSRVIHYLRRLPGGGQWVRRQVRHCGRDYTTHTGTIEGLPTTDRCHRCGRLIAD